MSTLLTLQPKNTLGLTNSDRGTSPTWDDRTNTWDEAVDTWGHPGILFTLETKNGIELLSNPTFTGSATGWTLGAGWAYATNSVQYTRFGNELVTNGSFTGSATGWTLGSAWSYGPPGSNHLLTVGSGTNLTQALTITPGVTYQVTFTTGGGNDEFLVVRLGSLDNSNFFSIPAALTTTTLIITAGAVDSNITFINAGSLICILDDVSVKEVSLGTLSQDIGATSGRTYPMRVTVSGTTGSVTVSLGGADSFSVPAGTSVVYPLVAGGSTLTITASADFDGAITKVSTQDLWTLETRN